MEIKHLALKEQVFWVFQRKIKCEHKELKLLLKATTSLNASALRAPFLLASFIAKAKKPFTIGEGLTLPAAKDIGCELLGDAAIPKLPQIPLLPTTITAAVAQSCLTLCDSTDSSPPALPSLGFSRQEHRSGLPFPSPMHESEKWKWSHSVMSDS